jgi:hypothetical protein
MKMKAQLPKVFLSVPCPTCGVASGECCLLYSGGLRAGPHTDRKFAAAEAVKRRKFTVMKSSVLRNNPRGRTAQARQRVQPRFSTAAHFPSICFRMQAASSTAPIRKKLVRKATLVEMCSGAMVLTLRLSAASFDSTNGARMGHECRQVTEFGKDGSAGS